METWSKAAVRSGIKQLRSSLDPWQESQKNRLIMENLLELKLIQEALELYCYMDFNHEAGTKEFIKTLLAAKKQVAVPRVEGNEIRFYYITDYTELRKSKMGILEPPSKASLAYRTEAVMLIPGVAFDKAGVRLGYGGGYYDRFLCREPNHIKIGLAYEFQVLDCLPMETWDIKMDLLVTDKKEGIYDFRRNRKGS